MTNVEKRGEPASKIRAARLELMPPAIRAFVVPVRGSGARAEGS